MMWKLLKKKRQKAEDRWPTYQKRISRTYNRQVKSRPLKMGDLVLKAAGHIQKGPNASKVPKWEGPYII